VAGAPQAGDERCEDGCVADTVEANDEDVCDAKRPFARRLRRRAAEAISMLDPAAVVTFGDVDGFRVVRSLGTAYGEAILPRNFLRATLRSVGAFIGLAPVDYLTDSERARADCVTSLLRSAERLGANGVVRVQFEALEMHDGATCLRAVGDAVLLEPPPRGLRR